MVAALGIGAMKLVTTDGSELLFAIAGGFLEVLGNNVRILTEACEASGDIDRERAEKKLIQATAKLEKLNPNQEEEYKAVANSVKKAETRIAVAAGKFN
jgi:F0F1-type ATP synthase epsilon subunit